MLQQHNLMPAYMQPHAVVYNPSNNSPLQKDPEKLDITAYKAEFFTSSYGYAATRIIIPTNISSAKEFHGKFSLLKPSSGKWKVQDCYYAEYSAENTETVISHLKTSTVLEATFDINFTVHLDKLRAKVGAPNPYAARIFCVLLAPPGMVTESQTGFTVTASYDDHTATAHSSSYISANYRPIADDITFNHISAEDSKKNIAKGKKDASGIRIAIKKPFVTSTYLEVSADSFFQFDAVLANCVATNDKISYNIKSEVEESGHKLTFRSSDVDLIVNDGPEVVISCPDIFLKNSYFPSKVLSFEANKNINRMYYNSATTNTVLAVGVIAAISSILTFLF